MKFIIKIFIICSIVSCSNINNLNAQKITADMVNEEEEKCLYKKQYEDFKNNKKQIIASNNDFDVEFKLKKRKYNDDEEVFIESNSSTYGSLDLLS